MLTLCFFQVYCSLYLHMPAYLLRKIQILARILTRPCPDQFEDAYQTAILAALELQAKGSWDPARRGAWRYVRRHLAGEVTAYLSGAAEAVSRPHYLRRRGLADGTDLRPVDIDPDTVGTAQPVTHEAVRPARIVLESRRSPILQHVWQGGSITSYARTAGTSGAVARARYNRAVRRIKNGV